MVFGTFDLFHAGHESLLKQAKELGDNLIVIVGRDKTVKKVKGNYPVQFEKKRLEVLKNHPLVDKATLGNIDDKHEVIRKFKPDIIALGYDQFTFTYGLEKLLIDEKMNTEIHRLKAYEPGIYKSSIQRKKQVDKAEKRNLE